MVWRPGKQNCGSKMVVLAHVCVALKKTHFFCLFAWLVLSSEGSGQKVDFQICMDLTAQGIGIKRSELFGEFGNTHYLFPEVWRHLVISYGILQHACFVNESRFAIHFCCLPLTMGQGTKFLRRLHTLRAFLMSSYYNHSPTKCNNMNGSCQIYFSELFFRPVIGYISNNNQFMFRTTVTFLLQGSNLISKYYKNVLRNFGLLHSVENVHHEIYISMVSFALQ